ncbi:response regulator transcription factor [Kaarinaea lacus]
MGNDQAAVTVFIIDDDESVRSSMVRLFHSAKMDAMSFASVDEFLNEAPFSESACIVADIQMPGTNALELPGLLQERHASMPVIFLSAQDTDEHCTAAKRAGAAGFFHKPVDAQALIDVINWSAKDNNQQLNTKHY